MLSSFSDGRLFGERTGDGSVDVVCLHGWGRSHRDAVGVLSPMEGSPLGGISFDLPGFGASPPPQEAWGSAEYAEALIPALEELGAPVVIMGHSHGGRVAVAIAAARPDLVSGLVLVGAPVLRRQTSAKPSWRYRAVRALRKARLISEERFEAIRRRSGSADYQAAEGVMRDTLVRVINESFDEELAGLAVPVLLVWGELDADVPLDVAERAKAIIGTAAATKPMVELVVVAGVGHLTVTAAPGEVRAAIDKVLALR